MSFYEPAPLRTPMTPVDPDRVMKFGVGVAAAPLWAAYFTAASAGMAYWWMTAWTRREPKAFAPALQLPTSEPAATGAPEVPARAAAKPKPAIAPEPASEAAPEPAPEPAPRVVAETALEAALAAEAAAETMTAAAPVAAGLEPPAAPVQTAAAGRPSAAVATGPAGRTPPMRGKSRPTKR